MGAAQPFSQMGEWVAKYPVDTHFLKNIVSYIFHVLLYKLFIKTDPL